MAQRNINNNNDVTDVVAPFDSVSGTIADIGSKIIETNQEARINENLSSAQLDLAALNNQYQIDNEADPFTNMGQLKQKQQEVFDQYGQNISPLFRRKWNESAAQLGARNDSAVQAWGYKQTRINTIESVNNSIKNNLNLANLAGQEFANSGGGDMSKFLNIADSRAKLQDFGNKNLGSTSTSKLLENYDEDHMKVFLSGVADVNPVMASDFLDDPDVRDSFKDPEVYTKFKDAVDNRALKVQDFNGQKEVLVELKKQNSVLARSLDKPIPYAELQGLTQGMSLPAQDFFLKANGYTKGEAGGVKLTDSQKYEQKSSLYDGLNSLLNQVDEDGEPTGLSTKAIKDFQNKVYTAMNNNSISPAEGAVFMNQITEPLVDRKGKELENFSSTGDWYSMTNNDDVGFDNLKNYFDTNIARPLSGGTKEKDKAADARRTDYNNENRIKLYDNYMGALMTEAQRRNTDVQGLTQLPRKERIAAYGTAQKTAKSLFLQDKYPALRELEDMPNQILDHGVLVQGAIGDRNLNPDMIVSPSFPTQKGSDGFLYWLLPDGSRQRIGRAKDGK